MMEKNSCLLIQTPPWGFQTVPLGIAYLSRYLQSKSFPVSVYDLNIEIYNNAHDTLRERWSTNEFEYWSMGGVLADKCIDIDATVDTILNFNAAVLGFSTTFASIPVCNILVERIRARAPHVIIIVGGAGPSYLIHRNFFKKDLIDYFVIGEGEVILFELLKKITKGASSFINEQCISIWYQNHITRFKLLKSRNARSI